MGLIPFLSPIRLSNRNESHSVIRPNRACSRTFGFNSVRGRSSTQGAMVLDWNNDPVPGHHGRAWKSDNCGRKAGIWNYWAVAAIKYGFAGTLLAEVKFICLVTFAFCLPFWLVKNGMIKKYGPPVLPESE